MAGFLGTHNQGPEYALPRLLESISNATAKTGPDDLTELILPLESKPTGECPKHEQRPAQNAKVVSSLRVLTRATMVSVHEQR